MSDGTPTISVLFTDGLPVFRWKADDVRWSLVDGMGQPSLLPLSGPFSIAVHKRGTCKDIGVAMVTNMISQLQESFPLTRATGSFEILFTKCPKRLRGANTVELLVTFSTVIKLFPHSMEHLILIFYLK